MANFLHSTAPNDARMQEATFNSAIGGKWGLPDMSAVGPGGGGGGIGSGRGIGVRGGGRRTADRYMTLQRHDYVNTTDPRAFAHPAHVVEKAWMSPLSPDGRRFSDDKRFEADLGRYPMRGENDGALANFVEKVESSLAPTIHRNHANLGEGLAHLSVMNEHSEHVNWPWNQRVVGNSPNQNHGIHDAIAIATR